MGIGSKLENLLKERNIKVSELARAVGIAPTTIYSIINRNNKKVDIDILLAISDYLGVKAEYFRDGSSGSSALTALTAHEQEHMRKYRAIDDGGREMVDAVLDTAYKQITDVGAQDFAS